jgi:hypothetical protein
MNLRLNWLLVGGVTALLALVPEAAQSQERGRETQRNSRKAGHTSGSVGQPTQRRPAETRERDRGRTRTTAVRRPRPVVLPKQRAHAAERRSAPRRVTVIQRSERPARPLHHPVTVIERPITRPTYRPIRWGTTAVRLPQRHKVIQFGDATYYVSDGVYYVRGGRANQYVVVRPPVGTRVAYLPSDSIVVAIDKRNYYFYDDVWYDNDLTVVACPYGGWVYALPEEYEVIEYGDERYYRVGGAVYQPGWRDGRTVYFRVEISF